MESSSLTIAERNALYTYFKKFPYTNPREISEKLNQLISEKALSPNMRTDRMCAIIRCYIPLGPRLAKGESIMRYVPSWKTIARMQDTEIAAALATYDAHFPHTVGGDQMHENIDLLVAKEILPAAMKDPARKEHLRIVRFLRHAHTHGEGGYVLQA